MNADTIYARIAKLEKERATLRLELARLPEPITEAETRQRELMRRMLGNDASSKLEQIRSILEA